MGQTISVPLAAVKVEPETLTVPVDQLSVPVDQLQVDTPQMNFATVNGQRVPVNDGPLDLVAGAWNTSVGAIPGAMRSVGKALIPEVAARAAGAPDANTYGPVNAVGGILAAQNHVKEGADAAWAAGDYKTAVRKYADWLLPIIGPAMDASADKMGGAQPWRGAGEAIGLGLGLAGPKAVEVSQIKVPALAGARNPVEAAAVNFGEQHGVPIDAATATGNPFVRNIQKATAQTPIGSIPAMRGQAAQTAALTRVGGELADAVYPEAVAPEQAGEGLRQSLNFQVRKFHGKATDAYDRLRRYESDPEHAEMVPSQEQQALQTAIDQEAARTAGRTPTPEEWGELRRIREELDAMQYQKGGTVENAARSRGTENDWTDGDMRSSSYVQARGGAPVYQDILQAAPGTSEMTRAAVQTSIDQAIKSGRFTNAARGALDVAKQRLAGSFRVSSPKLPPGAGAEAPVLESMMLPVDLRVAKSMLRPVYDRLMRQLPITQARSSPGLKAIENIVNGPDFGPVSQVDADLGAIKAIARTPDLPELKDISQGLAAQAVKRLSAAVDDAVAKAGPDAVQALEEGRAATRAKYSVAGTLKKLREEPVQAFAQTVYRNDSGIKQLRQLAKYAPAEMPRLGRAFLDDLLQKATSEGGFDKAKTLQSSWANLGPETKRLLFPEEGHVQALDNYFRLAKMIGENPNPSGSGLNIASAASVSGLFYAPVATIAGNLGSGAISALMNSPEAVRLFTKGSTLMLGPGKTSSAARSMGIANLLQAAKAAGIQPAQAQGGPAVPQGQP